MCPAKQGVPIKNGLFVTPDPTDGKPRLLGSRCPHCGEVSFPQRHFCRKCSKPDQDNVTLGPWGRLYSYTVVRQRAPGYIGEVPYILGKVDLPEGERVLTLITDYEEADLKTGAEMELVIKKLGEDENGNEVLTYMFRPADKDRRNP